MGSPRTRPDPGADARGRSRLAPRAIRVPAPAQPAAPLTGRVGPPGPVGFCPSQAMGSPAPVRPWRERPPYVEPRAPRNLRPGTSATRRLPLLERPAHPPPVGSRPSQPMDSLRARPALARTPAIRRDTRPAPSTSRHRRNPRLPLTERSAHPSPLSSRPSQPMGAPGANARRTSGRASREIRAICVPTPARHLGRLTRSRSPVGRRGGRRGGPGAGLPGLPR